MNRTIVLNTAGPHVRVKLRGESGRVTVCTPTKVQSLTLGKRTNLMHVA